MRAMTPSVPCLITHAVAKWTYEKAATPGNVAPPAVGCAVRTKEKISDAALFPNFPGH